MFSTFRIILVILLAMLQLIAPLVHAHVHARENISTAGLHIPGLESYGVDDNAFMSSVTKIDDSFGDVLVMVNSGIKQNHATQFADLDNSYFLPARLVVFRSSIYSFDINFSPQFQPFAYRLLASAHSPRAPPAP